MHKLRILILYPDPAGLALLTSMLKSLGHIIEEATNDRLAVKLMERNNIDLVLAGVDPLDGEALELLTYVRRKHREVPVILLFPRLHPERAKEALRLGAMAVLKYPVPAAELRAAVLQALELCEARASEPAAAGARTDPDRRAGVERGQFSGVRDGGIRRSGSGRRAAAAVARLRALDLQFPGRDRIGSIGDDLERLPARRVACPGNRHDRHRSELAPGHRPGGHDRGDPDIGPDRR